MRTPPARGEDQTGKKKFFTNSSPDKQKDLILKALHTAPDQTNLFQTSSSLDFFMSSLNVCLPLPRVLCATGCWCTFMVSTWCMNSGPFLLLKTVKPSSPSLTPLFSHSTLHFWILYMSTVLTSAIRGLPSSGISFYLSKKHVVHHNQNLLPISLLKWKSNYYYNFSSISNRLTSIEPKTSWFSD